MKGADKGKTADKGKGATVIDRSKTADINMAVLKRIDNQTEEILATAGHVCLYRMSVADQQWQRKNVEGSLFLIKRRVQPRFKMVVLNKLSTDNYTETIHGALEIELNPPYLMYTHGDDQIHGIWFYEGSDLERLGAILTKILAQLPRDPNNAAAGAAAAAAAAAELQPQQAPAALQPAPAAQAAAASRPSGSDDTFWDRNVHVTNETLAAGQQQLVPGSSLLEGLKAGPSPGGGTGLQSLLKQAHQKHTDAQQQRAAAAAAAAATPPPAAPPAAATPAAGVAPPASGLPLLTPSFFQQLAAKAPEPAPAEAPAAPGKQSNGALHQLLSRAAKQTPPEPSPKAAAKPAPAPATSPFSQPPVAQTPPPAAAVPARGVATPPLSGSSGSAAASTPAVDVDTRIKIRAVLARLAANDAVVDALAAELKAVGLLS